MSSWKKKRSKTNNDDDNDDDNEDDMELDVVKQSLSMMEVKEASLDGRLIEAFCAGTAAVVTPMLHIQYRGEDITGTG